MIEGKSRVRRKLTRVEGGWVDRFACHALYHEDSFESIVISTPINPGFLLPAFPDFPLGKFLAIFSLSSLSLSPFLPPPRYFRNDGKWWKIVGDTRTIGNGRGVFFFRYNDRVATTTSRGFSIPERRKERSALRG